MIDILLKVYQERKATISRINDLCRACTLDSIWYYRYYLLEYGYKTLCGSHNTTRGTLSSIPLTALLAGCSHRIVNRLKLASSIGYKTMYKTTALIVEVRRHEAILIEDIHSLLAQLLDFITSTLTLLNHLFNCATYIAFTLRHIHKLCTTLPKEFCTKLTQLTSHIPLATIGDTLLCKVEQPSPHIRILTYALDKRIGTTF